LRLFRLKRRKNVSKKVRAVVMVAEGKLEIQEFPYPKLEEGAMIVKPILSGVCGTDKHAYKGESIQYAGTPREIFGPYPAIPGHENVAEVAEISHTARKELEFYGKELREGDRVVISPDIICGKCYACRHSSRISWCYNLHSYGHKVCTDPPGLFGGWAEYMYVLPGSHVYKVPDYVSDENAVMAEPMTVACGLDKLKEFSALPHEGFGFGDSVVIQGVGPIGIAHLVKARILGAGIIIAIDRSPFRLEMAKKLGADYIINVNESSSEERIKKVKDLTKDRGADGVDVVVECVGYQSVIPEGIEMLRLGGTYLEPGVFMDTGTVEINAHRHLCSKNIRLIGLSNLSYTSFLPSMEMVARYSKFYPFDSVVTHRFSMEKAEQAILKSMDQDTSMKVVVTSNP
jgi:L-iditol 2-dehydrogenase